MRSHCACGMPRTKNDAELVTLGSFGFALRTHEPGRYPDRSAVVRVCRGCGVVYAHAAEHDESLPSLPNAKESPA